MPGFLSKEWLDGFDLTSGGPGRPVQVRRVVSGGARRRRDARRGGRGPPGPGPGSLTLTTTHEVAAALDAGDVAPAVAYMQGRMKAEGDMPTLYAVLAGHGLRWRRPLSLSFLTRAHAPRTTPVDAPSGAVDPVTA